MSGGKENRVDYVKKSDVLKILMDTWAVQKGDYAMQDSIDRILALPGDVVRKREECCANCAKHYKLEKLDYSQGGCKHSEQNGFICAAFADEGVMSWMIGLDEENEMCEEYRRLKRNG